MSDMLAKLYAAKAAARERAERTEPIGALHERAAERLAGRRSLREAIANARGPALIAEIKRASPSVGLIVRELDPAEIASTYAAAGADAISVLTEEDHFLGELRFVEEARQAVSVPVLRKDFLATPYEIAQSAAYGADAVLAIVAGLSDAALDAIMNEAARWKLDVLVEVHTEAELRRALIVGASILGINNRDLHTFETDLSVTEELLPLVPPEVLVISESGVSSAEGALPLFQAGARGVLVGEALMRSADRAELVRSIKGAGVAVS